MNIVTIKKLKERPDALVKHNIPKNYTKEILVTDEYTEFPVPKTGECYVILEASGFFSTSTVDKVLHYSPTRMIIKTRNSYYLYQLTVQEND